MSEAELGYLAGLIDGEGTIGIYATQQAHLRLIIANSSYPLINWVRSRVGGSLVEIPSRDLRHKDAWQVVLVQQRAAEVIRQCRPYLVAKAPQADLALDFISKCNFERGHALTEDEWALRRAFADKSRELNRRGIAEEAALYLAELQEI